MVQQGAGCRVQGARCRGGGWRVQGAGCKVQGAGCRVQGAGCSLQGTGCRGPRSIPLGVAWIRSELLGEGAAREHSGRSGQRGADRDRSEPLGLFGGLLGFVRGCSGMLGTATPNGSRIEVVFFTREQLRSDCFGGRAPIARSENPALRKLALDVALPITCDLGGPKRAAAASTCKASGIACSLGEGDS